MSRRLALGAVLLFAALGLLFASPTALLAGVVPLCYLLAAALSAVPASPAVELTRTVSPATPAPGEPVTVTVTVTNTGDSALADLRVVDGVPDELSVIDGSPRAAVAVPAGASTQLSYDVIAKRGRFTFAPATVRIRPAIGTDEATAQVAAGGDTTLAVYGTATSPQPEATRLQAGTVPTNRSGPGLEFRSVREYRHGDALARLDWRRYAKTGELATVEYREEHAVQLFVLVECRPPTRVVPKPGYPTAAEAAAYAGRVLFDALDDAGHAVGAGAVGLPTAYLPSELARDGLVWLGPEAGRTHHDVFDRVEQAGADTTTAADQAIGDTAAVRQILTRLQPNTHVVLVSPVVDEWPAQLVRQLTIYGHSVTVISPTPVLRRSTGAEVERLARQVRLRELQLAGARVVDWDREEALRVSLETSVREVLSP